MESRKERGKVLAGTDALGRRLPSAQEAQTRRKNRYVGIFYFLWLGQHGDYGPYDNSKILAEAPEAVHDANHPLWGPQMAYHFWGEPLFGYYSNDDPWVLRKHVQMLTNASIDFLVFDTTNAAVYKQVYDPLFETLEEVRRQGFNVPKFAFYTNTRSGETIEKLFRDIYQPNRYPELWFYWKGKPLVIGDPEECPEEIRSFFTFRRNQWPNEPQKINGFPWMEFCRPQRVFYNDEGEKEVINVSVAQHPTIAMSDTPFYQYGLNWGRSFHNGVNDETPGAVNWGYNIEEQWTFAWREDPEIIFITGWNEWIAMRFPGPPDRPNRFVDQATLEFSRDIEPMKGGCNDNYYMQMIGWIRRFKGMEQPAESDGEHTIPINDDFRPWKKVSRVYRDFAGDTLVRNHRGAGAVHYRNVTGRNDFVEMKVAHDAEYLYFYCRTNDPISPSTDKHWMMLLINTDGKADQGWHGYDFIVNRCVEDEEFTWVEQSLGGWKWKKAGRIRYAVKGCELHLAIPRQWLGLEKRGGGRLRFEFKWADNMQREGYLMDFYEHGDAAPDGRLNYLYEAKE